MLMSSRGRIRAVRWRGSLLVSALFLIAAFAAVNSAGAVALGEQCSGTGARGLGAFLQYRAQTRWGSGNELGFNGSPSGYACSGSQGSGGRPEVSYVPTDSASALRAWGAADGARHEEAFGFPVRFVATDIAPAGPVGEEGSMLNKMHAALGSDVVVVPVTQTAIAIVANPPALPGHAACTVPRINATQLQKVFSGEIKNWRQLAAASDSALGGDCDQAITRVAREESAGTTYQFKHYLDQVNPAPLPCTGKEPRTWSQLQAPFGGETPANVEWPRTSACQEGEGPLTTVAKGGEGEAGPLQFVVGNRGTITYASLPEALDKAPKQIIDVHNGAKFASPETESGSANCSAAKYPLPEGFEKGVNVDWSQVYGSNPKIGEAAANAYPICTLSWDLVPADAAGLFGGKVATTLRDYLRFIAYPEGGGGAAVRGIGYQDLPGYVAEASELAINQIGGEEKPKEEEPKEEEPKEEPPKEEPPAAGTGTVLCNVPPEYAAGTLICPGGQQFTSQEIWGSVIEPATFQSTSGPKLTVTCHDGSIAGTFKADGTTAGGGLAGMTFKGCETDLPESPEAYLYLEGTPYDAARFVYIGTLAPQGALALARQGGGDVFLVLQGLGAEACSYRATFLSNQMANGTPSRLVIQGTWELNGGEEEVCPHGLQESAQTTLQWAEGPLYIAAK